MEHLIGAIGETISRHPGWAGAVLGAVTFVESLAFVGAFVPATALMVLAGGLAAAGVLDPFSVIFWCVAGAFLGDAVSYSMGRRFGSRALRIPALRPHRRKIARARLFTRRYSIAAIFIGRFFGPLRAFVPLVAGMMEMNRRTFQIANAASAAVWVPIMLAPGYFAAKGLARLEALGEADALTLWLIGAGVAVAIVVALSVFLVRRRFYRTAVDLAVEAAE